MKLATTDSDRRPLALVSRICAACMKWALRPVTSGDPQGLRVSGEAAAPGALARRGWWQHIWAAWCRFAGAEVEGRSAQGFTAIATADLNWLLSELNTLRAQRDDLHQALNRYAADGLPRLMSALNRWAQTANIESDGSTQGFLILKLHKEAAELCSASFGEIDRELADVLIVALRLCHVRGKDPLQLIRQKMPLNVRKYGGVWEG